MNIFQKDNFQILKEIEKKSLAKRIIMFLSGLLLIAISYNLFLEPNYLVPGGITGIAIICKNFVKIESSIIMYILNAVLLIISFVVLGDKKTKASILGSMLLPLFIIITKELCNYIIIDTSELLLSSVFGGLLFGFGAGLVFKTGFTTGGTDIINQIFSKYFKTSMGTSMLLTDGLIVLLSSLAFGVTHFMYSIIVLYIISMMSDKVILGISDSKAFYIVTEKDNEVKEYITKYLNHGVTILKARGGFQKENRNVLMCVLPTKDYYKLKSGINEVDKNAFFVVTDAYEVFGGE